MSLELFKEDLKKHSEGSPCYIAGMTFYVRRIGTPESKEKLKEISEALYGLFPAPGEIDQDKILAHWLHEYGVAGWENVRDDEDKEEIKFCLKHAGAIFLHECYRYSLNSALIAHANNYENYLYDSAYRDIEEIKKP